MKRINYLFILILMFACACMFACKPGNNTPPEEEKELFDVVAVPESYEKEYEYDEFKLEFLQIRLVYADGTTKDIPVTEDMIDSKDLSKLDKPGSPRILITYKEEYQLTYIVKLIDSSDLDKDLNKDNRYQAVIKAIRNGDTINFILEPASGVAALSFAYKYDNSIMQLNSASLNSSLNGVGNVKIEEGRVMFAYTNKDANITSETTLFSVKYTGDCRTSTLGIDEAFDNVVYTYDTTLGETALLNNILYHASIK